MCYAPTEVAEMEVKDSFFDQLQSVIDAQRGGDHIILIGDFNAKVGSDNSGYEQCIGREGCGTMNDNGTRLANFCLDNGLIIGGTRFPHKEIHKLTWRSPDGKTVNQIDHFIVHFVFPD